MTVAATTAVAADALLVWGWRVPFLLAIITLIAAIVLRYNMPESQEVRLLAAGCSNSMWLSRTERPRSGSFLQSVLIC